MLDRLTDGAGPVDERIFTVGERRGLFEGLRIGVSRPGRALDISSPYRLPIVNDRARRTLSSCAQADFEFVRVVVDQAPEDDYWIANVVSSCEAFDRHASLFTRYPDDFEDPRLRSQLRMVVSLAVDAVRVPPGMRVFRLREWATPVIVTEPVKAAIEDAGLTGVEFGELSGEAPPGLAVH